MHHVGVPRFGYAQTASIEHFQHRRIFRQNLGDQPFEPGASRQACQVAQQRCADTLALELINDNEGQLRHPRLAHDIAAATNDLLLGAVFDRGNESNMADEIDIQEKGDLLWVELSFWHEETAGEGLGAEATYRGEHVGSIVRSEGANLDATPVAQPLSCGICRCL